MSVTEGVVGYRIIIAGGRDFYDYDLVKMTMARIGYKPTVIVSGCARGADTLGINWAIDNFTPVDKYPADWDRYGKSAGYKRNVQMAENADMLIAFWDGKSKGTKHMIDIALSHKLIVLVVPY